MKTDQEPKPQIVRISLSCHLIFGKCRFCGKGPDFYYDVEYPIRWLDPRKNLSIFLRYQKYIKRFCFNYYLRDQPRYFLGIAFLAHVPHYKKYNPRLHKNRGVSPVSDNLEFLSCTCGQTSWAFNDKSIQSRPEIHERKARHKYPHKFEDWD